MYTVHVRTYDVILKVIKNSYAYLMKLDLGYLTIFQRIEKCQSIHNVPLIEKDELVFHLS